MQESRPEGFVPVRENNDGKTWVHEKLNPHTGYFYSIDSEIVSAKTPYQSARLVQTSGFGKALLIDDITQVTEQWEYRYHEPLVHPVLLAHPCPERVLLIGGGDGGSLREILRHKTVKRVDFAELDADIVEFSRDHLGHIHQGAFDDSRVHNSFGDGRKFVEEAADTYDVIIMDMTDPEGPSRFLYTKEFFVAIRAAFRNDDGLFSMHSESPVARPAAFACIGKTLSAVFPRVATATAFVPMYGTLWSWRYAGVNRNPADISPEKIAQLIVDRMETAPLLVNDRMWGALFAPDPLIVEAEGNAGGRIITDLEPDFPDCYQNC